MNKAYKHQAYEDFLLSEYNNIAQAHFNTVNSISTFFRQYLLIVSLPFAVVTLFLRFSVADNTKNPISSIIHIVPLICLVIACAGYCVMCYISNLRFDAILYARTVNGIRQYFTDKSDISIWQGLRYRVLPRSIFQPRYCEPSYFLWVVLALALINSIYLGLSVAFYCAPSLSLNIDLSNLNWKYLCASFGAGFLLHIFTYYRLSYKRESTYLKSRIIGIDIDGVLSDHRKHFCKYYNIVSGKVISPDAITIIPVHECEGLGVTEEDEHAVFNNPDYWITLPLIKRAADIIDKLSSIHRYKIYIFTHRPWPNDKTFPRNKRKEYTAGWNKYWRFWNISWNGQLCTRLLASKRITKAWLTAKHIKYDKLYIEGGNTHSSDLWTITRNRFIISGRKSIKIFIEDDLYKAIKLSSICEIVFLLDQPYNHISEGALPSNVIRVNDWLELYKYIRNWL